MIHLINIRFVFITDNFFYICAGLLLNKISSLVFLASCYLHCRILFLLSLSVEPLRCRINLKCRCVGCSNRSKLVMIVYLFLF